MKIKLIERLFTHYKDMFTGTLYWEIIQSDFTEMNININVFLSYLEWQSDKFNTLGIFCTEPVFDKISCKFGFVGTSHSRNNC